MNKKLSIILILIFSLFMVNCTGNVVLTYQPSIIKLTNGQYVLNDYVKIETRINFGENELKTTALSVDSIAKVDISFQQIGYAPVVFNDVVTISGYTGIAFFGFVKNTRWVVTVKGKNADGNYVAGAELMAVFNVAAATGIVEIDFQSTPTGRVIDHIINDNPLLANSILAKGLNLTDLKNFIKSISTYSNHLPHSPGKHPTFINTKGIANDLKANGGTIPALVGVYTLSPGSITGTINGLIGTDKIKVYSDDAGSIGSNKAGNTEVYTISDVTASNFYQSGISKEWKPLKIEWTNKPKGWGADYIFTAPSPVTVNTEAGTTVNLGSLNIKWPLIDLTTSTLTPLSGSRLQMTTGQNFHPDKTQYTLTYPGLTGGTVNGNVLDIPTSTQMDVNIPKGIMDSANLTLTFASQLGVNKPYDLWVNPITAGNNTISDNSAWKGFPRIIIAPDGTLYTIWQDDSIALGEIMIKKSIDGGQTWTNPVTGGNNTITDDTNLSQEPNMAIATDGTLYAVWRRREPPDREIMIKKSTNGGQTWTNPVTSGNGTISNTVGKSEWPTIVIHPNNTLYVIWHDGGFGDVEIVIKKSTDGGVTWTNPVTGGDGSISNNGQGSWNPDLVIGGDGTTLHVVWQDSTLGNLEIMYRKSTNGGQTWINPVTNPPNNTISENSGSSERPKIAIAGDGTLHLVWYDSTPGNNEIMYRKSSDSGQTWTNPITAGNGTISNNSGSSSWPSIAIGKDGTLHVVWQDDSSGSNEIMYKKSTDGGITWINPLQISNNTISNNLGSSTEPQIKIGNDGTMHVIWTDTTLGNEEIMYKQRRN